MTKRFKKLVPLLVVMAMLLGVFMFVGCDTSNLTLEQRLTNLETAVTQLEEQATTMDNGALLAEIARLRGDADALQEEAAANGKATRLQAVQTRLTVLYNDNGGDPVQEITDEILNRIRQDYFTQVILPADSSIQLNEVQIQKVYGIFDGFAVVRFYTVIHTPGEIVPITIGGIEFDFNFAVRIIAWQNGRLYNIIYAYDNGLLSQTSIQKISNIDNLPLGDAN